MEVVELLFKDGADLGEVLRVETGALDKIVLEVGADAAALEDVSGP